MIDVPVYDSARRPPPALDELTQIFKYRDLVRQLVRRDIVTRYKRSALGVAWTMLNPLGMMIVLSLAFSQVFGAVHSFPAYLLSGLIAWNFFSQTTVYAMRQLLWGGALIQRIYIPKTIFAVSAIGTGLVNILLSLIPLIGVMLATGLAPQPVILFLPIPILCLAAFTLGVGLFLSAIAVYFPDVAEMYEIVLTAWMYLTPIIYPEQVIPEAYRAWLFGLNPMYHLIRLFRLPLYDGVLPGSEAILPAVVSAAFVLALGWIFFARKADDFAYRI